MTAPLNFIAPVPVEQLNERRLSRFTQQVSAALNALIAAGVLIQSNSDEWTIDPTALPASGVTAGSYTLTAITVNAQGIVTAAANGTGLQIVAALGYTPIPTPLTTKGDIFVRSTVDTRLPVGANNYVVTADSGQTTGLKWSLVSEDSLTLADLTTWNAATTRHGFLKKLPNDGTLYMDGQGNWTVPPGTGTGTVTTTGSPTTGALALFSGASAITSGNLSGDVVTNDTLVANTPNVNHSFLGGI